MLLTNTTIANTNNTTVVTGNVICGVALRGCSARPEHFADQPSEKRGRKSFALTGMQSAAAARDAMYLSDTWPGHLSWHPSPSSHQTALRLLLGCSTGRSLS